MDDPIAPAVPPSLPSCCLSRRRSLHHRCCAPRTLSILLGGLLYLLCPHRASAAEGWPDPLDGFTRDGWSGNIKDDWSDDYTFYYQMEALDLLLVHLGFRECKPHNIDETEDAILAAQRAYGLPLNTLILSDDFWSNITAMAAVKPGDDNPAVLALRWLMDMRDEATRGPLWEQHSLGEYNDCKSYFSDELADRFVRWWSQLGIQYDPFPSATYNRSSLNEAGLVKWQWFEALRQPEVRNVGGCEGRAILVKIVGTGFIVVWLALALTFLAFFDDSGRLPQPLTQAVQIQGIPPSFARFAVLIAYPCLAMLGMTVAHFFAMLGTRAWVYDWAQVLCAGTLVIGGALIFLRIMSALGDVSVPRVRAACMVTVFIVLNLAFFLVAYTIYQSSGLDSSGAGDVVLAVIAIIAFLAWGCGIYRVTAYARLWRATMLVVSCIFIATIPPVLLFFAHLMVGIEVVMPCLLVLVCFFIEHVLGGFATQRCEFTAETQWLLSYCLRYPVEVVRFFTVAALLLDCLRGEREWWLLIVNLLLTLLIEAKVVQLSTMCRSKPTSSATASFEFHIPFTAGEIFLQTGVSPWSWRSMAVAPVLEFLVIGTHLVQVMMCGIPVGVSTEGWLGGLALVVGMSVVREVAIRLISSYVGLRLPVTRVPWEMMRVHHLALIVGAAAVASSQATFMHLSRMYVHHWHACIVRPAGVLASNDWEAGGPVVMALVSICALALLLLSWLGWRSYLQQAMKGSLKSRPSVDVESATTLEVEEGRSTSPDANSAQMLLSTGGRATTGWGDALGNLDEDEEDESRIMSVLALPLKLLTGNSSPATTTTAKRSVLEESATGSVESHGKPLAGRSGQLEETAPLLPGSVENQDGEKDSTGVAPLSGSREDFAAVVPGAGTGEQPDGVAEGTQPKVGIAGSGAVAVDTEGNPKSTDNVDVALEQLSHAMAAKDRAEIEVALSMLEALDAGNHPLVEEAQHEIKHIQSTYQQRQLAEQNLAMGGSIRDKVKLQRVLTEARVLGVEEEKLEEAEQSLNRLLEEEERATALKEKLQLLIATANASAVPELREALAEASQLHLTGEDVEEARSVLKNLESNREQQEATRKVYDALANRDIEAAMSAMSKAKRVDQIASEEMTLASEQLRTLIGELGEAHVIEGVTQKYRKLRERSESIDPAELEPIVDQFNMLGAQGPVVEEAKRELARISQKRKQASAMTKLEEAIEHSNVGEAAAILEEMRNLQVDEEILAEPQQRLKALQTEVEKQHALEALERAVNTRGRDALEAAIAKAVELGLEDHPLCESARGHVFSLQRAAEKREAATRELIICMDTSESIPDLEAAIQNANLNNVEESKVAEAEACLRKLVAREEHRESTTQKLRELTAKAAAPGKEAGGSDQLRKVVEEAEKAGCGRSDIDAAKQALQHLVALEEQEALMNQIQEYLMVQDLDSAMAAIARAKRSPVANDAEILVVEEELDQLLKETEVEEAKQDAVQRVGSALQKVTVQTLDDLERFIDQARMLGATEPVIDEASERLSALKVQRARDDAMEKLSQALMGTDIEACKACYDAAKEADVDAAELEKAMDRIEFLQAEAEKQRRQGAARATLNTFIKNGMSSTETDLTKAIEEARAAGLAEEEIAPAEELLKEVQLQKLREAAMWKVKECIYLRNPETIRAAIDAAVHVGVKEADIQEAEAELHRVREEIRLQKLREAALAKLKETLAEATTEKIKAIEEALHAAKEAGVSPDELVHPEEVLAALVKQDQQDKACAAFTEAVASQQPEKVEEAIAHAKEVGIDEVRIGQMEKELRELKEDLAVANDMQQMLQNRTERASTALQFAREAKTPAKAVEEIFHNELSQLKAAIVESRQAKLVKWKAIQGAEAVLSEVTAELRRILEQKQKEEKQRAEAKLHEKIVKVKAKNPVLEPDLEMLSAEIREAKVSKADTAEAERLYEELKKEYQAKVAAAQAAVKAAVEAVDGFALSKAVDTCKTLALSSTVTQACRSAADILESKIAQARHESEKEKRVQQIASMDVLLELVRHLGEEKLRRKLHNDIQDLKGAVRVYCRIRPFIKREKDGANTVAAKMEDAFTVSVQHRQGLDNFAYDAIFGPESSQEEVYEECRQLVQSSVDGYNVTIFTYGQTGAGKTWTLYGSAEQPGISPRTCEEIFKVMDRDRENKDFVVKASMVELYLANLRDLLNTDSHPPPIEIHPEKGRNGQPIIRLQGVIEKDVANLQQLTEVIGTGLKQRKVKATNMNATSSRSHLLLMITIDSVAKATGQERHGRITIVDLAGCERLSKSGVQGQEMKEAIEINKSLTALGDVMMAITTGSKVVPYRNHKLTQLMQDSLGGSAKTLMFVNISPASSNSDESVNALKYASRARCIENDNNFR